MKEIVVAIVFEWTSCICYNRLLYRMAVGTEMEGTGYAAVSVF